MPANLKIERQTSQKKIVLDYLKNVTSHPSAEDIFAAVRKKLPQISFGTIYRILNNFKEKGEIQEIPSVKSRFDGDISNHAHFICEECDKIYDIFDLCENCGIFKSSKLKVGKIKNYQMYFYGKCKKCS